MLIRSHTSNIIFSNRTSNNINMRPDGLVEIGWCYILVGVGSCNCKMTIWYKDNAGRDKACLVSTHTLNALSLQSVNLHSHLLITRRFKGKLITVIPIVVFQYHLNIRFQNLANYLTCLIGIIDNYFLVRFKPLSDAIELFFLQVFNHRYPHQLQCSRITLLFVLPFHWNNPVSYTHLRAHETRHDLVCRLLLEKKKKK